VLQFSKGFMGFETGQPVIAAKKKDIMTTICCADETD
jgi:hypothetical protein